LCIIDETPTSLRHMGMSRDASHDALHAADHALHAADHGARHVVGRGMLHIMLYMLFPFNICMFNSKKRERERVRESDNTIQFY
jgi:hypothetical protein